MDARIIWLVEWKIPVAKFMRRNNNQRNIFNNYDENVAVLKCACLYACVSLWEQLNAVRFMGMRLLENEQHEHIYNKW